MFNANPSNVTLFGALQKKLFISAIVVGIAAGGCSQPAKSREYRSMSFTSDAEMKASIIALYDAFKDIAVVEEYLTKSGYTCQQDKTEKSMTMDCKISGSQIKVTMGPLKRPVFVSVDVERRVSYQVIRSVINVWVVTSTIAL